MVASFKKTGRDPISNPFAIEKLEGFSQSRAIPCCIDRKNISQTRTLVVSISFSASDEDRTPLGDSKALFSIGRVLEVSYSLRRAVGIADIGRRQVVHRRAKFVSGANALLSRSLTSSSQIKPSTCKHV